MKLRRLKAINISLYHIPKFFKKYTNHYTILAESVPNSVTQNHVMYVYHRRIIIKN